jgi:hypothetical protein
MQAVIQSALMKAGGRQGSCFTLRRGYKQDGTREETRGEGSDPAHWGLLDG